MKTDIYDELFDPPDPPERKPRRKRTLKKDLEATVLKECLTWLHAQGYYTERRNTGAIKTDNSFFRFGRPGAADIFAVIKGLHIEIECKRRKGGKLSASQEEFRDLMKDFGIPYFVVRSAEELAEKISERGLTR